MTIESLLSAHRSSLLKAAVDRVIPADDYPSGWELGVGDYFLELLTQELHYLPIYQSGLDALDWESLAVTGLPFTQLSKDQQDGLLTRIEAGDVETAWACDPARFFRLLVEQALEGYYADPGNGGNRNGLAWEMIGYKVTG
jgi:hypothetical protein